MPFQPNPRAGAPDPQFVQFFMRSLERKADEKRLAEQDKLDALGRLAKEKRVNERHDEDMALLRVRRAAATATFMEERAKAISRTSEQVKDETAFADFEIGRQPSVNFENESNDPSGNVPEGGGPNFAQIVGGLDSSVFDATPEQRQVIEDRAFAGSRQDISRLAGAEANAFGGDTGQLEGTLSDRVGLTGLTNARIKEEDRLAVERVADTANRNLIERPTNQVEALDDRIYQTRQKIKRINNTEEKARLSQRLNALVSKQYNENFKSLPGAAITNTKIFADELTDWQTQGRAIDLYDSLIDLAKENPNFLGFRGQWSKLGNFLFESIDDIQAIVSDDVIGVMSDPRTSEDFKNVLRDRFILKKDSATGKALTQSEQAANTAKYIIMRANNPDRMSQKSLDEQDKLTELSTGTTASAMRKINNTRDQLIRAHESSADRLRTIGRAINLRFDENDNYVIDGVTYGRSASPRRRVNEVTPEDFSAPSRTPEERAKREASGQHSIAPEEIERMVREDLENSVGGN